MLLDHMEPHTEKFVSAVERHSTLVIAIILLITVVMTFAATKLQLDADAMSLLPEDNYANEYWKEMNEGNEFTGDIFFMVESDNLYVPHIMDEISSALAQFEEFEELGGILSPFTFVTAESRPGGRIAMVPMAPHVAGTRWTQEEVDVFKERILNCEIARNLLVSEDGNALLFYYPLKPPADEKAFLDTFKSVLEPLSQVATVSVNGSAAINERSMHYLTKDLVVLLGLSALVILIVYYLSFRAKRAVFIPFSLSIIGSMWTFGAMSFLGYTLTIVNIVTPPLVLILGSSYSIHVISEYFSNYKPGAKAVIAQPVARIGRTIMFACLTTIAGFLSLTISEIQAVRQFGISVSLGVAFCALLCFTYLPAVLTNIKNPKPLHLRKMKKGCAARIMLRSGSCVAKRWPYILLLAALIFGGFLYTRDKIELETNFTSYFPQDDPFVLETIHFAQTMGGTDPIYITIDAPDNATNYFLDPEIVAQVFDFEQALQEQNDDIFHVLSYPSYIAYLNEVAGGAYEIPENQGLLRLFSRLLRSMNRTGDINSLNMILNEDASQMTISMRFYDAKANNLQSVHSARRIQDTIGRNLHLLPQTATATVWGNAIREIELNNIVMRDQMLSTALSLILVFLLVLIAFKSFASAVYACIPVMLGIMSNYIVMFVFGIPFDLITVSFCSITIGIGIDDAIHFLLRFRNITRSRPDKKLSEKLKLTLRLTGRPIMLTSFSIIAGMLVFTFGSYTPIQHFGLLVAFALFNEMVATLIVLPSVMLGVDWLKRRFHARKQEVQP